jgi:hypothetical protein
MNTRCKGPSTIAPAGIGGTFVTGGPAGAGCLPLITVTAPEPTAERADATRPTAPQTKADTARGFDAAARDRLLSTTRQPTANNPTHTTPY